MKLGRKLISSLPLVFALANDSVSVSLLTDAMELGLPLKSLPLVSYRHNNLSEEGYSQATPPGDKDKVYKLFFKSKVLIGT